MQGTSPSYPLRELNESVHFRTLSRSIRSETRGGRFARWHRQQKWFREAHVFETAAGGNAQHYTFWVTYAKGRFASGDFRGPFSFSECPGISSRANACRGCFSRVYTNTCFLVPSDAKPRVWKLHFLQSDSRNLTSRVLCSYDVVDTSKNT